MGAGTNVVHAGAGLDPRLLALEHEVVDLGGGADGPLGKTLNENTALGLGIFSNLQRSPLSLKQVRNGFIVNLEVAGSDHKLGMV